MSNSAFGLNHVEVNGRKDFRLTISMGHILDNMGVDDRKEFVENAIADGVLLGVVCRQIGRGCADYVDDGADIILDDATISKMRIAVMPLLSEAHALEMAQARKDVEASMKKVGALDSLMHVDFLYRTASNANETVMRANQYHDCLSSARLLYPEFKKE